MLPQDQDSCLAVLIHCSSIGFGSMAQGMFFFVSAIDSFLAERLFSLFCDDDVEMINVAKRGVDNFLNLVYNESIAMILFPPLLRALESGR